MSAFLGVPVDAAFHVVSLLVSALTPLLGGLAAAAAIVGATIAVRLFLLPLSYRAMRGMQAQARVAPQAQALRSRYAGQPDRLQRELTALYRAEGTSMFAGCLPLLVQWPVFGVLSLLFRSRQVGGAPNTLLTHRLFGTPLASYWLGGTGPFTAQGAVFAGLFVLLAGIGWLSARMARPGTVPVGSSAASGAGRPPGADLSPGANGTPAALGRVLPYVTVAVAAFAPLAAGLYLLTTTAWTLAERAFLQHPRSLPRPPRSFLRPPRSFLRRYRAARPAIDRRGPAG
jgi:YidC/Oxa1 family membrane protein insertase